MSAVGSVTQPCANWRVRLMAGLSLAVMSVGIAGGTAIVLHPASAHAQIFGGDDDDKDNPTQPPTDSTVWDAKKLQRLDRNVRKLERSVQHVENKSSPPILIEPDPEVVALQATVDSLSRKQDQLNQAVTQLTGQLEDAQHNNQLLTQQVSALTARTDTLIKRADLADAHLKDIDAQLAPPPPPPPTTGSAEGDFEQAFNLMTSGKTDDSERAFEAFTTTWPEATQLPEAWYRLGQLRAMKSDVNGAIAAYATALKGWPKTSWAPEATVRLAGVLSDANRPKDACAAISQFDKVYARAATAETRALSKDLKAKDKCS
ncbi:tetratricopeptide repeat protein [Asticcacaulis sp. EMRT-3]|uniref:tetratricopeptide repeat protein n=1 Tax=Asticcacaulis sp. EMRT-3 TaxID=3040349 RepID=UPI0024AFAC9D|nr:tetratricopeptide repeat protein [Asticcacaulis sp. EMRT-3]MDI7775280.1 tetratricopeptide repeat protein [Asticcacaulis sp. EMRT-3]